MNYSCDADLTLDDPAGSTDGPVVGAILLSTDTVAEVELGRIVSHSARLIVNRVDFMGQVTVDGLGELVQSQRLESAAGDLASRGADVIVFCCTSASLLGGRGFDAELAHRLAGSAGVPASTTASCVLEALGALQASSVCVGTPYVAEVNERERVFLEAAGFRVMAIEGLGLAQDPDIARVREHTIVELADKVLNADADALFLSCTNLPALDLVPELERRYALPVITSNTATAWWMLRHLAVVGGRDHFGILFRA